MIIVGILLIVAWLGFHSRPTHIEGTITQIIEEEQGLRVMIRYDEKDKTTGFLVSQDTVITNNTKSPPKTMDYLEVDMKVTIESSKGHCRYIFVML